MIDLGKLDELRYRCSLCTRLTTPLHHQLSSSLFSLFFSFTYRYIVAAFGSGWPDLPIWQEKFRFFNFFSMAFRCSHFFRFLSFFSDELWIFLLFSFFKSFNPSVWCIAKYFNDILLLHIYFEIRVNFDNLCGHFYETFISIGFVKEKSKVWTKMLRHVWINFCILID